MGSVYVAEDPTLGRRVALKVVRAAIADSAEARVRLQREARCAAAVSHPGVAHVFDAGESEGRVYIAMELVAGRSLRALMRAGAIPRERALRLLLDIVRAVGAAHDAGVAHRDLKPENIMVGDDDVIKVLDFGLATWIEVKSSPAEDAVSPTLSEWTPGRINGTPGYLSPEQARGQRVTARADIFSLGVIGYELLFGERPFCGDTTFDLIVATTRDEPVIPSGDSLGPAIAKALAKNPDDRFESAHAFEAALLSPNGAPLRRTRTRRTSMWLGITGVVLAVGILGGFRVATAPSVALAGMIHFPRASYEMGSTSAAIDEECKSLGDQCKRDQIEREQPPRTVVVGPLYVDIHEVTNKEFTEWLNMSQTKLEYDDALKGDRFVKDYGNVVLADLWPGKVGYRLVGEHKFQVVPGRESRPAVQVAWDGARAYCQFRGKRLPTEAEWEYVARGTGNRRYPWGDDPPKCDGVVFGRESGPCVGGAQEASDVMTSLQDRTPDGIFDLAGNASEWVEDAFLLPYYPPCGACDHPVFVVPAGASDDLRVFRGSGWSNATHVRTSRRGRWKREEGTDEIGFRCASDG